MNKQTKTDKVENICFVIMPYGAYYDNYYINVYKPAIEAAGLISRRADDLYRPSTIIKEIWRCTREAKIILADLTGLNANVFYELGLAHALAKPTILVTNSISDIPFDLRSQRIIEYDTNLPNWGFLLKEKIEMTVSETVTSPISSILPAFMDFSEYELDKISISGKDFLELKSYVEKLATELRVKEEIDDLSKKENDYRVNFVEQYNLHSGFGD